jgi:hypothetical protein
MSCWRSSGSNSANPTWPYLEPRERVGSYSIAVALAALAIVDAYSRAMRRRAYCCASGLFYHPCVFTALFAESSKQQTANLRRTGCSHHRTLCVLPHRQRPSGGI